MGFLKGYVTFRRYRVVGDSPPGFKSFFDGQIKMHSFNGHAKGSDEKIMGWTSIQNVLDTDFEYANYQFGDYALFSLRVDRKILPPALLRIRTMEAEQRYMKAKGLKKLFREQRLELKETVKADLLKSILPVPSFYEACWALFEGWLLFGSHSEKVAEDFEELFKRTFSMSLVPFFPWDPSYLDGNVVQSPAVLKKDSA
ncbi:MAG: recombination-associated protein RdgC [Syntrophales bacterium]|nr:recombination-associated protein RdgC [Syntrophales bacterium]